MPTPSKLTPEVIKLVAEDIEAGVTLKNAGSHVGVSDRSLRNWVERGEKFEQFDVDPDSAPEAERIYAQFAYELHHARRRYMRELEMGARQFVKRGVTPGQLQILERLDRDTWGKKEQVDHQHGLQIQVNLPSWRKPALDAPKELPAFDYDADDPGD